MLIPGRVAERAASRYEAVEDGCHISTYSTASHGYAQIGWWSDGKNFGTTAHRAAWVHFNGQIPDDMTVDHRCSNRRCVNVDHLRLLTNFDNGRRTNGKDWPLGQCINGHPDQQLKKSSRGRLYCPECNVGYQAAYRNRKREKID